MPAGSIIMWGGSSAPSGWVLCNGGAINRTTYTALFAILGTTYGNGDGSTTFNVPNTKDVVVIGAGDNNGRGTGSGTQFASSQTSTTASGSASLSTTTGSASVGAKDAGSISVLTSVSSGGHTHNYRIPSVVITYIIKT